MEPLNSLRPPISKAEFARRRGVTSARVSQWISAGQIDGAAIVGVGRHAQIDEALASQQLEARLDLVQRQANEASATFARPIILNRAAAREMGRVISTVVEGVLPDLASNLAAEFGMPAGEVLSKLRRGWRAICEQGE